mmetsp:Transcript_5078/g.11035  ORF Transcript_5078/g.11035 Transcript_5078/m.11035 type:complete len:89 (+) Transcript_5078:392-658(+)
MERKLHHTRCNYASAPAPPHSNSLTPSGSAPVLKCQTTRKKDSTSNNVLPPAIPIVVLHASHNLLPGRAIRPQVFRDTSIHTVSSTLP